MYTREGVGKAPITEIIRLQETVHAGGGRKSTDYRDVSVLQGFLG